MRMRRPRQLVATEHQEQAALFEWIAHLHPAAYPELQLLLAIPNGGLRNVITARRLKAEGVKPGVPDLCLPVARGVYHGLFIEMKRRKGSKVSDEQVAWLSRLRGQGLQAIVCRGWEEARQELIAYLSLRGVTR